MIKDINYIDMGAASYGFVILMLALQVSAVMDGDHPDRWSTMSIQEIDDVFDRMMPGSYEFDEAEVDFDRAILGCPGSDECLSSYYGKGRVLNDNKAVLKEEKNDSIGAIEYYKEAILYFDRALEIDPECCQCLDQKGWSLSSLEDYDAAMRMVDEAIEICPSNAHAWNNKGIYYYYLNDYQKALECFNRAIEIDPDFGDAWYDKGVVLTKLLQTDEADAAFAKATELGTSEQSTGQED